MLLHEFTHKQISLSPSSFEREGMNDHTHMRFYRLWKSGSLSPIALHAVKKERKKLGFHYIESVTASFTRGSQENRSHSTPCGVCVVTPTTPTREGWRFRGDRGGWWMMRRCVRAAGAPLETQLFSSPTKKGSFDEKRDGKRWGCGGCGERAPYSFVASCAGWLRHRRHGQPPLCRGCTQTNNRDLIQSGLLLFFFVSKRTEKTGRSPGRHFSRVLPPLAPALPPPLPLPSCSAVALPLRACQYPPPPQHTPQLTTPIDPPSPPLPLPISSPQPTHPNKQQRQNTID
jgi:hypothetical protein